MQYIKINIKVKYILIHNAMEYREGGPYPGAYQAYRAYPVAFPDTFSKKSKKKGDEQHTHMHVRAPPSRRVFSPAPPLAATPARP